ncbi:MAG: allantoate amidohydrolase [Bradyrhizobium sp.]|nr:MAG: allantoate amidohydrolase [Bradyrhizobium sp.]
MDQDLARVARRLMERLDALTAFTDDPPRLTRLFLSPAHRRAAAQYIAWAREAGLEARIDPVGNIRARYEGREAGAKALMIGSHIDTVRDAGRYDGALGALAALAVVETLAARGRRLDVAIEIVAFGDEEGVRFPRTMTGSRALAGVNEPSALEQKDAAGVRMRDALIAFGGAPDRLAAARADGVAAFVELHIEQGPVLEAEGRPLGVVNAINGATRLSAIVYGAAGHAGASPMNLRHDALAAAAEMILAIETRARAEIERDLVATVGRLDVEGGAVNVIPGKVRFSIDVRSPRDEWRRRAVAEMAAAMEAIAARRGVAVELTPTHEAAAYACDLKIIAGFEAAVASLGLEPRVLPSGAGHDTMIMGQRWPAGMLFVRCKGGVSHNPAESISGEDCAIALAALTRFVEDFRAP